MVLLFDVDNTLLDNDAVERDFRAHMLREAGDTTAGRYWEIFEQLRGERGYADYLGALQRYRLDHLHDPRPLCRAGSLLDYPFPERLYPNALEVLSTFERVGPTAILSDGD